MRKMPRSEDVGFNFLSLKRFGKFIWVCVVFLHEQTELLSWSWLRRRAEHCTYECEAFHCVIISQRVLPWQTAEVSATVNALWR